MSYHGSKRTFRMPSPLLSHLRQLTLSNCSTKSVTPARELGSELTDRSAGSSKLRGEGIALFSSLECCLLIV